MVRNIFKTKQRVSLTWIDQISAGHLYHWATLFSVSGSKHIMPISYLNKLHRPSWCHQLLYHL